MVCLYGQNYRLSFSKLTPKASTRGQSYARKHYLEDPTHHILCPNCCCDAWHNQQRLEPRAPDFGDRLRSSKILPSHPPSRLENTRSKSFGQCRLHASCLLNIGFRWVLLSSLEYQTSQFQASKTCDNDISSERRHDSAPSTRIGSCKGALSANRSEHVKIC